MFLHVFKSNLVVHMTGILTTVVATVALLYTVLVMYPNLPIFLDRLSGETNAPVLYLYEMLLGIALFALTIKQFKQFVTSSFFLWLVGLFAVYGWTLIRLLYFSGDALEEDISHAIDRIERALLIPVFAIIMFVNSNKSVEKLFVVAALLVPIPIILGFFFPEFFVSSVGARAAGTYYNANQASEAVLLWFLVANQRLYKWLVLPFYILAGLAVLLTFSRSGLVGWALTGAYLVYSKRLTRLMILVPVVFAASYSTIIINAEDLLSRYIENESTVERLVERIDVFGKIGGGSDSGFDDDSSEERGEIAGETLRYVLKKPILGYGYDVERELGLNAHNMPLQLWFSFGLPGLALYFWLIWLLFRAGKEQSYGKVSPYLLVFVWFSLFDHAHTTDNYWLIIYAFVCRSLTWRNIPAPIEIDNSPKFSDLYFKRSSGRKRRRRRSASAHGGGWGRSASR